MKKLKLISAVCAAVMLLCGCSSPISKEEIEPPEMPEANEVPDNITITGAEMQESLWYQEMCAEILNYEYHCKVSERVTNQDVKKALAQLPNDYPEVFWLGDRYLAETCTDGSNVDLGLLKDLEEEDIPAMAAELEEKGNEIIAGVPEGSTYDKVLYIHDYITENCKYDYKGADSPNNGLWGTSYGCLVQGSAVCQGYAEAFIYLMNKLGIESGICTGSNHAWNYVNIDGKYYWLDATWDDMDSYADDYQAEHTYFLVNSDMILRSRNIDWTQGYFPDCTSIDENYFVKNNAYFDSYDRDKVIGYIEGQADKPHCEMMFSDYETYKKALYDLINYGKIYKASNIDKKKMKYYRSDKMFVLDIIF